MQPLSPRSEIVQDPIEIFTEIPPAAQLLDQVEQLGRGDLVELVQLLDLVEQLGRGEVIRPKG